MESVISTHPPSAPSPPLTRPPLPTPLFSLLLSCSGDVTYTSVDRSWHPWSTWSACSETCGNGQQSRRRMCSRENVSQYVFDLLSLFGIPKLPFGVTHSQDRNDAYVITPTAKLFLPVSSLYDVTFPHDFSIIMTSRRKAEQEGYVLVVSDISGRQRIAVYIGKQLRLEYMDDPSRSVVSLEFGVTLDTDTWHNIAIRVKGRQITLFFDCDTVQEKKLKRGNNFLGTNLMLSVGPYFANYGPAFEGELEQLLLSDDPGLAERQCHFQTGDHIGPIKDDNSNIGPDVEPQTTPNPPKDTHKITRPTLVYADWSPWSSCSDTCGQGRQSRTLSCTETELYGTDAGGSDVVGDANCVPNDTPRVQVRTCWVQACAVGCREPCQNGGTCVDSGVCRCLPGYYGNFCQSAVCSPGCENGGVCISPGKCQCPKNFTGNRCETPVCDPPCLNGGQCTAPNQCACPFGYTGANCQPFCLKECHNGGVCVRHDQCRCTKGYRGRFCKQPVCRRGCANGGKCVSPNRCSCPSGFRGRRCHKPRCRPSCKNGGKCIAPDVCMCPPGFLGARCQKYKCERKCRNGGKCVGPGRCECKAGFYGKFCQREKCNLTCLNGGRCRRHKNRCRCPKGFRGRRCEKRSCVYEQYTVPYTKTYKRTVREEVMTRCGPWSWKSCVRTIIRYVTVTKDAVRAAYRCV
ncbi:hypothetical protein BaRGS_00011211 [Batillaria attramentaria]|uniref:EGF-like domain-containing protein n=1 Tax=Batillaria attramentaria TaxID=370345 RepID=A0ABD0LE02_9CAEN